MQITRKCHLTMLLRGRQAHQVADTPVVGRGAIRKMFASGFAKAKMVCIAEHIFQDGEWGILEWRPERPAPPLNI
jgi:hypothetical protein